MTKAELNTVADIIANIDKIPEDQREIARRYFFNGYHFNENVKNEINRLAFELAQSATM